jgi:hypothetical protein
MYAGLLFISIDVHQREDFTCVGGTGVNVVECGGLGDLEEGGLEVIDCEGESQRSECDKIEGFQIWHYNISL